MLPIAKKLKIKLKYLHGDSIKLLNKRSPKYPKNLELKKEVSIKKIVRKNLLKTPSHVVCPKIFNLPKLTMSPLNYQLSKPTPIQMSCKTISTITSNNKSEYKTINNQTKFV
jgi:hypothetical protein